MNDFLKKYGWMILIGFASGILFGVISGLLHSAITLTGAFPLNIVYFFGAFFIAKLMMLVCKEKDKFATYLVVYFVLYGYGVSLYAETYFFADLSGFGYIVQYIAALFYIPLLEFVLRFVVNINITHLMQIVFMTLYGYIGYKFSQ